MSPRFLLASAAIALVASGALTLSAYRTPLAPSPRALHADSDESPLARSMEEMKSNLKKLGGALKADKQADALLAVAEIERCIVEAKRLEPSNLSEKPEPERAAHTLAFRKDLARLLQEVVALEIDLIDGKKDAVLARIQGSLKEMRDAGHERFQAH